MAIRLATTTELEVYLIHLTHGGCEFGLKDHPCFLFLNFRAQGKKEKIYWTKYLQRQFEDLEVISNLSFRHNLVARRPKLLCHRIAVTVYYSNFGGFGLSISLIPCQISIFNLQSTPVKI
jgi:hypothetical protein